VVNKTSLDPDELGGQTYWETVINEKADDLHAEGDTDEIYFVIAIPLVVLDTFYAKAKAPIQKLELRLTVGTMNQMVQKRYIHSHGQDNAFAAWDRATNKLLSFELSQANLLIPLVKLAPMSIVQLEENGDKPFAIAINYQKMKINTIPLTSTTNSKSLTVTNGRSLEVYIPEADQSLKCFAHMPYERFAFMAGGASFPVITINNYQELNRLAHGIKAFAMKPKVQSSTNYCSIDSIDSTVNKFATASPYYPHSFDLSLSDINDVLYENSPDKNTCTGSLQLNFAGQPSAAARSVTGQEWDYANAFVLQREDIICEFRKVNGVFTPVIVTNDV
jgi:hypothetical protein